MNLHEYQGKALFADYGLPVSTGFAVDSAEAAIKAAQDIGGERWVDHQKRCDQKIRHFGYC